MNCKLGDLAIIISSDAGNEGKIVRVIQFVGKLPGWVGYDRWVIDRMLKGNKGGKTCTAQDSNLRPLRDPGEDAQDETLQWLPAPSRDEVAA